MSHLAPRLMTVEAFLDWDDGADRRYELFDGVVRAMAPPRYVHAVVAGNLAMLIGRHLSPECSVLSGAGVRPEHKSQSFYVPDLTVSSTRQKAGDRWVTHPVVVPGGGD